MWLWRSRKPAKKPRISSWGKKTPQNKHQLINLKHTDMRREENPWQMWYWKNLWVCWLKPDAGLNKWKVVGGLISGADLIRSWHAAWPKDGQCSLVLLAQRALERGPGSRSFCKISDLPNEGGGDNLDGLQSKAIARTEGLLKSSKPFWDFEKCNERKTQTCLVRLAVFVGTC